jgi:hypothetical protein
LGTATTAGLLYQPRMIREGVCGDFGGMKIGKANRSTLDPGLTPGRRCGKPATNRLSYGAASLGTNSVLFTFNAGPQDVLKENLTE